MKAFRGNKGHERVVRIHLFWFVRSLIDKRRHPNMTMVMLESYRKEVVEEQRRFMEKKERKAKMKG